VSPGKRANSTEFFGEKIKDQGAFWATVS